MEVIWCNRLKPGDFKYIGGFPHFVADGGDDRVGQWLHEKIDLERIYAEIWKDAAPAHLVDVAVFCDSDDTHMASISYFAYVRLEQETDRNRPILFNSNTFRERALPASSSERLIPLSQVGQYLVRRLSNRVDQPG